MARPIVSDLRSRPGPLVVVTPSAPPKAAPSAAPTPAISSSAWKVPDAELLAPAELVQDVRGRRDRVAAEEQGQAGQPAAAIRPKASAWLPVTWTYSPFSKVAGLTS